MAKAGGFFWTGNETAEEIAGQFRKGLGYGVYIAFNLVVFWNCLCDLWMGRLGRLDSFFLWLSSARTPLGALARGLRKTPLLTCLGREEWALGTLWALCSWALGPWAILSSLPGESPLREGWESLSILQLFCLCFSLLFSLLPCGCNFVICLRFGAGQLFLYFALNALVISSAVLADMVLWVPIYWNLGWGLGNMIIQGSLAPLCVAKDVLFVCSMISILRGYRRRLFQSIPPLPPPPPPTPSSAPNSPV